MKKQKLRKKIYILDDHPLIREGLSKLINQEDDMSVTGMAAEGSIALEDLSRMNPDIIIVDLSLKDINGLDFIKAVRTRYPQINTMVLSMHDENIYAERALKAGARGYIMKQEAAETVIDGIRSIVTGNIYVSEKIKSVLLDRIAGNLQRATGILPQECLTNRELEVFQLIGQGLATREIAQRLGLSTKTVEAHREHIKEKLHLNNGNELILTAIRWQEEQMR